MSDGDVREIGLRGLGGGTRRRDATRRTAEERTAFDSILS